MNDVTILCNDRIYSNARDVIENGFDPEATLREIVTRGDVTLDNLDAQADEIWASFVELDRAEGAVEDEDRTTYYFELTRDDLHQYLTNLIEGTY